MTPPLRDLIACAGVDEIMAGLLRLGPDRFDDIRTRIALLAAAECAGRAEDLDALDPADRVAMLTPGADPEVIRCAQVVLGAIHRDMNRTPAGLMPIPRDVGSLTRLQDYRDASQYVILLIPYDPDDCTCGWTGKDAVHGGGCPAASDGGSWDRWTRFTGAVATEVSRLLAEEAAAIHAHRSAAAPEEVAGLRAAMLAAAEIADLPARFTVEQQPGQPRLIIGDQVSGRQAPVSLFAYGAVREVPAALFPSEPAGRVGGPRPPGRSAVTAASQCAGTSERTPAVTAVRPSYDEDSAWCQAHGHTGILAGCPTCDHLLATDPAFARLVEDQVHNLDGTRGRRNGHTAAPIR